MKNNRQPQIKDKELFCTEVYNFFNIMFGDIGTKGYGAIEIRVLKDGHPNALFNSNFGKVIEAAFNYCNLAHDVYFGVNPRIGGAGKKENVHYVTTLHVDIDYGKPGHKKASEYADYDSALNAIQRFELKPTVVIHTGGGFHCYWVLENPVCVKDVGIEKVEDINKALSRLLKGDTTSQVNMILRVPYTYNFKIPENPREVAIVDKSGPKYNLENFDYLVSKEPEIKGIKPTVEKQASQGDRPINSGLRIPDLRISDKMKDLILSGGAGHYSSRSEADMAVILALVSKGYSDDEIRSIFENYPRGAKYLEHSDPSQYLNHNIKEAKKNFQSDRRRNG